jgi:hypothetical protein
MMPSRSIKFADSKRKFHLQTLLNRAGRTREQKLAAVAMLMVGVVDALASGGDRSGVKASSAISTAHDSRLLSTSISSLPRYAPGAEKCRDAELGALRGADDERAARGVEADGCWGAHGIRGAGGGEFALEAGDELFAVAVAAEQLGDAVEFDVGMPGGGFGSGDLDRPLVDDTPRQIHRFQERGQRLVEWLAVGDEDAAHVNRRPLLGQSDLIDEQDRLCRGL